MAGAALLRIDQPSHPTVPVGQPGQARDDLILGQPVTVRNVDDTDVVKRIWALLDVPLGSTATLSSTTSPVVTFTPDKEGSYLLRLTVNDGLDSQVDAKVAAVRTSLGIRYPATGETAPTTNWPTNDGKGWGEDTEQALRALASPQLGSGVMTSSIPVAASTLVSEGGLGLPTSLSDITGEGFVQLAGAGSPPTVNGYSFSSIIGTGGKSIRLLTVDIDSSACTVSDEWALIVGLADVGDLLLFTIEIV